jgi:hypothetical protein
VDQSNIKNYLSKEQEYFASIEDYFHQSTSSFSEKMHAFPRFIPRQAISYFMVRHQIFQRVLGLHGSILDFGIFRGSSFFTWQQLSAILEPYNHLRKIVGFDSFEGFSAITEVDQGGEEFPLKSEGGMAFPRGEVELERGVELFDMNRPIGHVGKASIVKGDLPESFNKYLKEHPETIVALANFGLGLHAPTYGCLVALKSRLQRGSVLVFEDLNQALWPGESQALYEVFEPREILLERNPICPHISWLVYQP